MAGAAFLYSIIPLGISIRASISLADSTDMVTIPAA